jgi:hypothetical protein
VKLVDLEVWVSPVPRDLQVQPDPEVLRVLRVPRVPVLLRSLRSLQLRRLLINLTNNFRNNSK